MRLTPPTIMAGLFLALGLALSGCSAGTDVDVAIGPSDLLGEGLSLVEATAPTGASVVVQDVGQEFKAKSRYSDADWGSSQFVVIAACADARDVREADQLQLGVVNAEALSSKDVEKARSGDYRDYIGCSEGFFR